MSLREKARVRCLVTVSVYPLPRPKKTTFGDLKKIWVEEIHQIYRILTVCFYRCVRFTIHKQKSDILIYIPLLSIFIPNIANLARSYACCRISFAQTRSDLPCRDHKCDPSLFSRCEKIVQYTMYSLTISQLRKVGSN